MFKKSMEEKYKGGEGVTKRYMRAKSKIEGDAPSAGPTVVSQVWNICWTINLTI